MTLHRVTAWLIVCLGTAMSSGVVFAQNEGQDELDKATELQIRAQSLADLEQVAKLCEDALKKGLDEGNQAFAKQLLSSTLFQHASRLSQPIFEQSPPDRRWPLLRQIAVRDVERAIEIEPDLADAHLLIAKLQALPGGDIPRAEKAASAAVKLFEDDPKKQAEALVIRAGLREEAADRLKDYGRAIELDPTNTDAWQGRALAYMQQGEMEKAVADFHRMIEDNKDNVNARLALAEALTNMEKYDEAAKQVEEAIRLKPDSSLAYTLRARLHLIKEDAKAALADLDQAVRLNPQDLTALMIRARVHLLQENIKAAKADVEQALLLNPGLLQAILIRSMIAADEGRMVDAIADIQLLLQDDPDNVAWQLQLAGYYIRDNRQSKAIDIFTRILADDENDIAARQARADTLLSIGKHREAIADFEILLKQAPEDDSVLNNFAWVLATSPDDDLRNGQRAVKLATKACEVTKYEKPHILSTLAAAYAETGDFETARKWSQKAVELGTKDDEVDQQLKNELESYKKNKPWRERQTVEEKEDPVQSRRSPFEA
ncbi:MAG: tetratricopeptide repeat protein [Planctomycetes bacterium]|nr:tetratricopeptide repeat protein [Planctomycetota bacterium]